MSLSSRFSALFLTFLGGVLVGFSAALYVSARIYLDHQVSARLSSALDVLAAAAEVHPAGVEWEPRERILPLGEEVGAERLRWIVSDDQGRRVDHSRNLEEPDLAAWSPDAGPAELPARLDDRGGRPWRVAKRRIAPTSVPASGSRAASQPASQEPEPAAVEHPGLVLTVAAPLGPMRATLARLAGFLAAVASGLWLLAALLCRRMARRALAPLARMADAARGLDATDPGWALEEAGTGDELEDLGRAFNELLSRLHLAFARQRRFSGDASHQLRTPLTILIGQLEVALRRERSGEEYRRALESALGRAEQLRHIVEALLFLGRAESEAQLPGGEPLDLSRWVARHLEERQQHHGAQIVHRNDGPIGPTVLAHRPLLGQLLDNLIDNAEKYGGREPIVIETGRSGASAVLAVEDRGPGIPAAEVPRVFEPFYRATQSRRPVAPGVGLGLSVVQRIAVAFGGSVDLRSDLGAGCRVEVRLPSLPDEAGFGPSVESAMAER